MDASRLFTHAAASPSGLLRPLRPPPPRPPPAPRCPWPRHVPASVSGSLDASRGTLSDGGGAGGNDAGHLATPGKTSFVAETLLPTRRGKFRLRGYRHTVSVVACVWRVCGKKWVADTGGERHAHTPPCWLALHHHSHLPAPPTHSLQLDGGITYTEPSAIISGHPEGGASVPLRVHDACFTSEVLGSLKCDCADQLALALDAIKASPDGGLVLYLQQEGRGIGLANKIAAYALQEGGLDTVDANRALGLPDDCREYTSVAAILDDLRIESVALMTNNPRKLDALRALGINVTSRIPCLVQAGAESVDYLRTKGQRMAHMMGPPSGDWAGASGDGSESESDGESEGAASSSSRNTAYRGDGAFCYRDHDGEALPPSAAVVAEE